MTFKLAKGSIRETVLLEYLNLVLDTHSWVSLHNSLAFTQILLYYCKEFLWWLFQLQTDFQLTTLNGCSITGWIFYSQHHLVFVSYLHGLSPDFFQTTKRHLYNDYSTYMPSFIQFLPAIFPVGVTDLRSFLRKKINHNSINFNRILTKIATEMNFN